MKLFCLCFFLFASVAFTRHLEGRCFDFKHFGTASPNKAIVLHKFNKDGSWWTFGDHYVAPHLTIGCIASLASYTQGPNQPRYCHDKTILDSNFQFYIEAIDKNNKMYTFDLDHVVGGSVNKLEYELPSEANFTLMLKNENSECDIELTYVMEYELSNKNSSAQGFYASPALIEVSPLTIYMTQYMLFAFKLEMDPTSKDRVAAISIAEEDYTCSNYSYDESKTPQLVDNEWSSDFHVEDNQKSTWSHVFLTTGPHILCYSYDLKPFKEVARLTVYGENPEYYIVGKAGESIYLNEKVVFKFYGSNLDLRPGKDQAKAVFMSDHCNTELSGLTLPPPSKDLGPDDSARAGMATYEITFITLGDYRLCYKRVNESKWVEVPNFYDLPVSDDLPEPIMTEEQKPPGATDDPNWFSDYSTKTFSIPQACRLPDDLTERGTKFTKNSIIELTIESSTGIGHNFLAGIAELICVDKNVVRMYGIAQVSKKEVILSFYLDCYQTLSAPERWIDVDCDVFDRSEYAYYILKSKRGKEQLHHLIDEPGLKIKDVNIVEKGTVVLSRNSSQNTDVPYFDDSVRRNRDHHSKKKLWIEILFLIIGFVLVIILGFFAILAYMGRHGYATPMQSIRNMLGSSSGPMGMDDPNDIVHDNTINYSSSQSRIEKVVSMEDK